MTGEARFGDSDAELRRQQLIETITNAVLEEDYDFVVEVAGRQEILRPFELAEYMNVRRKNSEDPVEQRRWQDGLTGYLESMSEQEFPAEETGVINGIIRDLNFDSITGNEETAEEPEFEGSTLSYEEIEEWESEEFELSISEGVFNHIRLIPLFMQAEAYATDQQNGPTLNGIKDAVSLIQDRVQGQLKEQMRQAIDCYVFQRAEAYATGQQNGPTLNGMKDAARVIEESSSDQEAGARMRSALDKYIFERAEAYISGRENGPTLNGVKDAEDVIRGYASTPERCDAMLRRLGFM